MIAHITPTPRQRLIALSRASLPFLAGCAVALAALDLGFTWQLCIGTFIATLVCLTGKASSTAAAKEE